jgi:photosystem I P700 chlorophyll a apoprotein A2
LAIIHLWLSANLFQLGWNANYELYTLNPIPTIPIAHGIWDAHIPLSYDYTIVLSYSAIYNVVCTVGFTNVFQIYNFVIICELLAVISIPLGKVHLIYLEDTLQWCYIVGFTLNLELEIIHLHKKLALDILHL